MEFISTAKALAQAAPSANPARASSSHRLEPLRHVDAGVLNIAYYEEGPADGPVVVLLHGFPFDIHSYVDVAYGPRHHAGRRRRRRCPRDGWNRVRTKIFRLPQPSRDPACRA